MGEFENIEGRWRPSAPLPLWTGWRLRTALCGDCGQKFKGKIVEARYREHWYAQHSPEERRDG